MNKPTIGISCGDINGIGLETIIKVCSNPRIYEYCTLVLFANTKVLNFYKKTLPEYPVVFNATQDLQRLLPKQLNVFTCWEEDIEIAPGQLTDIGGNYAIKSLEAATKALVDGAIDGLVTAPIHKKNTQTNNFNFTGHTPYLKHTFNVPDVLMFMVADNMRVGLLTEHIPVKEIHQYITKDKLVSKLLMIRDSLIKDFGITKPKIAVLGLNPHAGDEGLIGKEEQEFIIPAIQAAKQKNILSFGPYSSDAFFARGQHEKFDAVLALYHDQGLIPFKSLAVGEGVNFTAGIKGVRTSPDHGVAFDIAGKGIADESSLRQAIFVCLDIVVNRDEHAYQYSNPLRKLSAKMLSRAVDQKMSDIPE
jgi:4-hydroxythreonine-4-phosphate dehydrogenase